LRDVHETEIPFCCWSASCSTRKGGCGDARLRTWTNWFEFLPGASWLSCFATVSQNAEDRGLTKTALLFSPTGSNDQ
jgi:hypothetical protein